jgi:phosphohistidine swiveling domain-containing protein
MNKNYVLSLAAEQADLMMVGGKGASLARLVGSGFPVPDGFHVTTAAYHRFVEQNGLQHGIIQALESADDSHPQALENASQAIYDLFKAARIPDEVASAVVNAYAALPGNNPAVAVRSSATAEDLPDASFAGQQETYLNVSGPGAVLEALQKCWASLWTARAIGYRNRQGIHPDGVGLAVVIQLLVPAEAAGIMFTANPINGRRDQVVISASWGLGEAIVGGKVTPDNLIVDKSSGKVLQRDTAEKTIQTVCVNGGTKNQPVPVNLRSVPVLSDQQAADLAHFGTQIEKLYNMPMDIEWTLMDGNLSIVQARPITALPEPEIAISDEFQMPDPKGRYMRISIVELLPDPVSPLFDTLGLEAINRGIGILCKDLFKMPDDGLLTGFITTINGYGYEQISFTPRQWWAILSRMIPHTPYMMREGVPYWQDVAHPFYLQTAARWEGKYLPDLTPTELLSGIQEVTDAFGKHLGALMGSTMGPSAGSEGLFTNLYQRLICREGDPPAATFLMGFDNIPIQGEKMLYDLAVWSREDERLSNYLLRTPTEEIHFRLSGLLAPGGIDVKVWEDFQARFRTYFDNYGYSIYDMDFAKPLPMDEPGPILEQLKLFIRGEGVNPYERQREYRERREQALAKVPPRLKGLKRWIFEKSLNWAQKLAPLREDGLAEIGLGYPILRRMLRELGQRIAEADTIEEPDDIFWLEFPEVQTLVDELESGIKVGNYRPAVRERKALWQGRKRLTPPSQLPEGKQKYMGFNIEAHLAGGSGGAEGNTIKGVPTSPGRVTGIARVLHGSEDFDTMQPGDILVAGITTPAWTPLFAMAAGVVTDIGGPLSHGSIIAREYGIPAVLGTGVGTKFIQSGQRVTVDGSAGTVTVLDRESSKAVR